MTKKQELLSRIPKLEKLTEPRFDSVMNQLNTLVWEEIDDPLSDAPAACTRTVGGTYVIFVSKANNVGYNELLMHEAGHIIKQHLKDIEFKEKTVARQIRLKWKRFRKHINMEGHEEDVLTDSFIHLVSNMVQDFEINSDYWATKEEWEKVNQRISDVVLSKAINTASKKELENIEKWMNEKPEEIHQYSKGCHPSDYGFPSGLSWLAYLHLILTKPNKFMKNMEKNLQTQENGGKKGNEKVSAATIDKAAKRSDVDNQKLKKQAQEKEDKKNGAQKKDTIGKQPGNEHFENKLDTEVNVKLDKKVIKFIEKNCTGIAITRDKQDYLYNYNRGKTSGVLRTRSSTREEYRPGNLVALIDVSGSVDKELIKSIVNELVKYRNKFANKSRIILWDTDLVADIKLNRESLSKIAAGGGTDIASGIEYSKKYLKTGYDKLCIISDFQDDMPSWCKALKDAKFDAFGICWGDKENVDWLYECPSANKVVKKMKIINLDKEN